MLRSFFFPSPCSEARWSVCAHRRQTRDLPSSNSRLNSRRMTISMMHRVRLSCQLENNAEKSLASVGGPYEDSVIRSIPPKDEIISSLAATTMVQATVVRSSDDRASASISVILPIAKYSSASQHYVLPDETDPRWHRADPNGIPLFFPFESTPARARRRSASTNRTSDPARAVQAK